MIDRNGVWTSAIAPDPPPLAQPQHWIMGTAVAAAILLAFGTRYAGGAIPQQGEEVEAVVVSLGAAAQRLEAPPENVQPVEEPSVVAERAEDAPPPAAPPQPRQITSFTQGDGRISSGTGAGNTPAPPPPAPRVTQPPPLATSFRMRSERLYMARIVYPAASLRNEESGMGRLRVEIDRTGRVLSAVLVKSTGYQRLDAEIRRVAAEVRQIDPLPAGYPADRATTDLTIGFVLEYTDAGA